MYAQVVCAATSVLLLSGTLAAAPAVSLAQEAALSGTVTDTTGAVLPGVTVEARDAAGGSLRTAVTDGSGMFTITVPAGTYDVTFTLPGFHVATRGSVAVGAGASATVDMELAVELEERVVVVGSRAEPRSVTESQVPIDAIPFDDVVSQGVTTLDYQLRTLVPLNHTRTRVTEESDLLGPATCSPSNAACPRPAGTLPSTSAWAASACSPACTATGRG